MSTCEQCQVTFEPKDKRYSKFCSRSCSVTYNNRKSPKRQKTEHPPRFCEHCDKSVSHKNRFCSVRCQTDKRIKARVDSWYSGDWNGSDSSGVLSDTVRVHLLNVAGHKCTECGWNKVNPLIKHGNPVLTIDHIDGNWKNNAPNNLVVLCYNCHTLTPNWGSLSKNGMSKERMGRSG